MLLPAMADLAEHIQATSRTTSRSRPEEREGEPDEGRMVSGNPRENPEFHDAHEREKKGSTKLKG